MQGKGRPEKGLCSSKGTQREHTNHPGQEEWADEKEISTTGSVHATSRRGGHTGLSL